MQLITLAEAKERLSIDFDTKDGEVTDRVNAIEGYLYIATGIEFSTVLDAHVLNVAREYVFLKLYLDYYSAHTEIDDLRLTALIKQLQVYALTV